MARDAVICEIAADIMTMKGVVPSMAGYEQCPAMIDRIARDPSAAEKYLQAIQFWPVPESWIRRYEEKILRREEDEREFRALNDARKRLHPEWYPGEGVA
jgi:hypothetical protein